VWDGVLANVTPGHQATWVDDRNDDRAPLLLISGGKDHIMPAEVNKENADRYERSGAHTDCKEFETRDHYTIGAPGWEAVTNYTHTWATEHAPGADASSHDAKPQDRKTPSYRRRQVSDFGARPAGFGALPRERPIVPFGGSFVRGERRDSNPRPPGPQPGALPTELRPPSAPPSLAARTLARATTRVPAGTFLRRLNG
jgi:hypothetical protein